MCFPTTERDVQTAISTETIFFKEMADKQSFGHILDKIKLRDGHEMPLFGLGVYLSAEGDEAESAVIHAIKNGYRLVDTAQAYNNEKSVGEGIRKCGFARKDVYVVTKLHSNNHGYQECKNSVLESLKRMHLEYVDLFLIHSVGPQGKNLESYDAMIELQKDGVIKTIGVSNFNEIHLEKMKEAGKPIPAVNQIELHPYWQQRGIIDYCNKNGIAVMGYAPLTRGKKFDDPALVEIAKRYGKTCGQLLLRWSWQKGYVTIPKSSNPDRIITNTHIFDFSISDKDMGKMDSFKQQRMTGVSTDVPWTG